MGGFLAVVWPIEAAVFKAGDAENYQFHISELPGWLGSPADSIRPQILHYFKRSLQQDGTLMFSNPLLSLLKTVVMLTGESDASSLSVDNLPCTSHVIFLLFVFLVAIILLKFFKGLTVSDADANSKHAEKLSPVAIAILISEFKRQSGHFRGG
jgi:hypothetical protein